MPQLPAFPDFLRRLGSSRTGGPPVRPRSRLHRHRFLVAAPVVLLVAAGVYVSEFWKPCGDGLHSVGSPHVCVGLNLESGPMRDDDPLADLEGLIAQHNAQVAGDFKTIVVLENMTPDPDIDTTPMQFVRHEIEGALTAAWPTDRPANFKVLLANFGSNAQHWQVVVDEILAASASQRIMAVAGLGVSLDNTRKAAAALSRHGIATIGATVTADNVNTDVDNTRIKDFFRVGPTNSDEAHAAGNYVKKHGKQRVMLVADTNESDGYAATLASAFQEQPGVQVRYTKKYDSLSGQPVGTTRDQYLQKLFAGMHSDICTAQPDVIYFAGRGVDLRSFVTALSHDGACQQLSSVTVISGDDTSILVGAPLPLSGDIGVELLYTGLAYPGQWDLFSQDPAHPAYKKNYNHFIDEFSAHGFSQTDLRDGAAMIEHDAVATAVKAAEENPSTHPKSITNFLSNIDCNSAVPGASGFIAFDQATGNQLNKAMPILQIMANGQLGQVDLVWSRGHPLDTSMSCSS
ncbi:ABC transporter substrate-binding protein [Amycolatopsis anabasis]|uniref:ABC transporter substrate-binding protein n=1 Tax=Amycolatopsis anabasis TaxID=1840409 RepID=UPI00131C101A|nr:ABC transporter substrate-binding protein [Amycolatopsis anabasis]